LINYRALLIEYRVLIEYRALLIEYRALLTEYRALLIEHRALFQIYSTLLTGHVFSAPTRALQYGVAVCMCCSSVLHSQMLSFQSTVFYQHQHSIHTALLSSTSATEYTALLIEYMALLIEYRALLIEYRAVFIQYSFPALVPRNIRLF